MFEQSNSNLENEAEISSESENSSPARLEEFQKEIEEIFEQEKSGSLTSGHFSQSVDDFSVKELGPDELNLWQDFKSCQSGEKPIEHCVQKIRDYRDGLTEEERKKVVVKGLVSYLANKITAMHGQQQLKEQRQKKQESLK